MDSFLVFIVDCIILLLLLVVFASGRIFNLYKTTMPEENIIVKTAKCIWVRNKPFIQFLLFHFS